MENDLTTGAWQHDIGCPISITLLSTSDIRSPTVVRLLLAAGNQEVYPHATPEALVIFFH